MAKKPAIWSIEEIFSRVITVVIPIKIQNRTLSFSSAFMREKAKKIMAQIVKRDAMWIKTFLKNKKVLAIQLDPLRETADINEKNNTWNIKAEPAKFEVFKAKSVKRRRNNPTKGENPMQKAKQKQGALPILFNFAT